MIDKEYLEKVIPQNASPSLDDFIHNYNHNFILDIPDSLYVYCRFAGHLDNLQKKLWSQSNLNDNEKMVLDRFDAVLQKLPSYSGDRVCRVYANSDELKEKQLIFFKNNIAKVFEVPAYLGTSAKDWEDDNDYVWKIELARPSKNKSLRFENLGLDPSLDSEFEVIFPIGTRFKIIEVHLNTIVLLETNDDTSCFFPV